MLHKRTSGKKGIHDVNHTVIKTKVKCIEKILEY